eukprot:GHVR01058094.1.p1 GENE.GHVR01058094.1~~GHVR01058094.1.p1  ORF type:complete len:125 (-),score=58.94 GHVR01058094.1:52-426(-)
MDSNINTDGPVLQFGTQGRVRLSSHDDGVSYSINNNNINRGICVLDVLKEIEKDDYCPNIMKYNICKKLQGWSNGECTMEELISCVYASLGHTHTHNLTIKLGHIIDDAHTHTHTHTHTYTDTE